MHFKEFQYENFVRYNCNQVKIGEHFTPVALTLCLTLTMVVYEGFYASQAPDVPMRLARYVRVSFKLQRFKW